MKAIRYPDGEYASLTFDCNNCGEEISVPLYNKTYNKAVRHEFRGYGLATPCVVCDYCEYHLSIGSRSGGSFYVKSYKVTENYGIDYGTIEVAEYSEVTE